MGSYCCLSIGGYKEFESKSEPWEGQLLLFTSKDRIQKTWTIRERMLADGDFDLDDYDEDILNEREAYVAYRAKVWQCIQRLDVQGITLKAAEHKYESERARMLQVFKEDKEYCASEGFDYDQSDYDLDCESVLFEGTEEFYERFTFRRWIQALGKVVEHDLHPSPWDRGNGKYLGVSEARKAVLQGEGKRSFGYLGGDFAFLLRCLLEVSNPDLDVELNLSELIDGGYLDEDEPIVLDTPKFIVLTEGKSDKWILEESLAILYPHLSTYYKFADFESSGLVGGASNNINVVRSFIALSIKDRLIVLFDNDAEGVAASIIIKNLSIPDHVRVTTLPDLGWANNFPTRGPTGDAHTNINGRALAIEMYLGRELFSQANTLLPIRWTSLNGTTNTYQGSLDDKKRVQKAFAAVIKNQDACAAHDWSDLRLLFESLFLLYQ